MSCLHLWLANTNFGGYMPGVISYHLRTIWKGVIIHAGTAWAMENLGFLWRLA